MKPRRIRLFFLIPLLLPLTMGAQFRDMWGSHWNNPVSSFIGSSLYWKTMTRVKGKLKAKPADKELVYFTPAAGGHLMTATLAASFSEDPDLRRELTEAFKQFLQLFNTQIATGADRFNIASAAAFFMVSQYHVATGKEVTDGELEALRDALQENLSHSKALLDYDHKRRQELYESLVIFALLARYGFQQGREQGDEAQMDRFRTFARECLKAVLQATPEEMVFTAKGLVFRPSQ